MPSITAIVLIASLALCAADVSHLSLSRNYLPPLSGASGYSTYSSYPTYPTYPSYTGSAYSSGGYYSGSGLGSSYGAPAVTSGYNSYATVPQYNSYATPSRAYLPALTSYAGTGYSGLDTKYASNGGYIY
ncbi:shematrin-like protein 1 [Drosophila novamexicana]|uniref:shematrin-like protein 1 n=1 Tax=Drosophila novamexicana TaxID=47314 RepID=UPI0011E5FEEA|nr:shematrin-like protein 1 [Drosophila novamexicana]